MLDGDVEVDGAYFGGYVKPANHKDQTAVDRRLAVNQNGKRRVVVIMRERNGRTLPFVFKSPRRSRIETIGKYVEADRHHVYADEARGWDASTRSLPHEADQSRGLLFGRRSLHEHG